MQDAARGGIALLALYYLISGLAMLPSQVAAAAQFAALRSEEIPLSQITNAFGLASVTVILFAVIPAVGLFVLRGWLAARIFPADNRSNVPLQSGFYAIGCSLLGYFFLVEGASGLVGGIGYGISTFFGEPGATATLAWSTSSNIWLSGVAKLIGGFLVLRHAVAVASRPVRSAA